MELQFQNKPLDCLQMVLYGRKSQEQTQEVRLPEAMPDVGKILAVWGQTVLRGKQWQGTSMSASGGVMVWVLYAPEDNTFPRVVEAWIPYQLQWELPPTQRDGIMRITPSLQSLDARAVSARKLMIRACVEAAGEAYEPVKLELYAPEQLPENIYVLPKKYPVCMPTEAGEKTFTVEETLQLPSECDNAGKLIHYSLQPQIQEKKRLGNKLLFRGTAILQGLCRSQEDRLCSFYFEIPFSQFTELEQECAEDAGLEVMATVTNLEVDLTQGGTLVVKASMVGQYLVCDRKLLEVVEDAYSPGCQVKLEMQELKLPVVLEMQQQSIQAEIRQELEAQELLDISFLGAQPEQYWTDSGIQLQLVGSFQVLYRDETDSLQSSGSKWEQKQELPTAEGVRLMAAMEPAGPASGQLMGNSLQLRCEQSLERTAVAIQTVPMVTAIEVSEKTAPAEGRPSLILRRPGSESLWQIAKACDSSEAAIRAANGITEETVPDKMLLIPTV